MTENNENNLTEPQRPRYLPPLKPGQKEQKISFRPPSPSLPPKLPVQSEPRDPLLGYSAKGRLGRLSLLAATLVMAFAIGILSIILITAGAIFIPGIVGKLSTASTNPLGVGIGFGLILFIVVGYTFYFMSMLSIRRLHDMNLRGWWVLLYFVPNLISGSISLAFSSHILSMVAEGISDLFLLFLILAPGTKGANRFGAPRPTNFVGKLLAAIGIIGVVTGVAYGQYKHYFPDPEHPTDTTLVTSSNTANSGASGKYQAPYPFTAQQFWAKMLKLTALPDGTLSKAQIEGALDMTMLPDKDMSSTFNHPYFKTTSGVDWYFSSSFEPDMLGLKDAQFRFGWTDSSGSQPPAGMCINANDVRPSIISQGWVESSKVNDSLGSLTVYWRNVGHGESLRIYSDAGSKCITGIKIMAQAEMTSAS